MNILIVDIVEHKAENDNVRLHIQAVDLEELEFLVGGIWNAGIDDSRAPYPLGERAFNRFSRTSVWSSPENVSPDKISESPRNKIRDTPAFFGSTSRFRSPKLLRPPDAENLQRSGISRAGR